MQSLAFEWKPGFSPPCSHVAWMWASLLPVCVSIINQLVFINVWKKRKDGQFTLKFSLHLKHVAWNQFVSTCIPCRRLHQSCRPIGDIVVNATLRRHDYHHCIRIQVARPGYLYPATFIWCKRGLTHAANKNKGKKQTKTKTTEQCRVHEGSPVGGWRGSLAVPGGQSWIRQWEGSIWRRIYIEYNTLPFVLKLPSYICISH